ncbi:MAG: DinB family protein [Cyclobacteriaceae bacterium]
MMTIIQMLKAWKSSINKINTIVHEYVTIMHDRWEETLIYQKTKRNIHTTPTELFTHVITHEFHHKGQVMMIARSLGYVPPDSDAIRF